MENTRKMFKGEILIIDDEVNDPETDIYKIKHYLEDNRFLVRDYYSIPLVEEIEKLNIAFVICDWKFNDADEDENAKNVIEFLNELTKDKLIPVFICTTIDKTTIKSYLSATNGCKKFKDNEASCIFVVDKSEIKDDKIFEVINNWLNKNPSIKTMKSWENSIDKAKEKLFSDLYNESEYWPLILYQSFETDGDDPNEEMGQFLLRNLFSRVSETYAFEKFSCTELNDIDILKILNGERTFYYKNDAIEDNTLLHTGDIFELSGKFYINIKRQCDLMRGNNNVYLLDLESAGSMSDTPIKLSDDKKILSILGKNLNLENKTAQSINNSLSKAFSKTNALHKGKFLEKAFEVIIPCVYEYEVCKIDLRSLNVIPLNELKKNYKRKARLLEPYINIVTEKFASYVSSKGAMRTPETLLTHKFIYDTKDNE